MPKGSWRIRPGEIEIRVGEPIPVDGLEHRDRDRLASRGRAAVKALLEEAEPEVGEGEPEPDGDGAGEGGWTEEDENEKEYDGPPGAGPAGPERRSREADPPRT